MELVGAYSNHADQAQHIRKLLEIAPAELSRAQPRTRRQAQRRMSADELERFKEDYFAGTKINELAEQYGINRNTVMEHVVRLGLPRRYPKFSSEDLAEAIRRYQSGQSLATIGKHFKVPTSTVQRALLRTDVKLRPRPGWGAASTA